MALIRSLRAAVLSSLRVPISSVQQQAAAPTLQFWRGYAADASYLDKSEVTDRVLNVVKNFEKVEQGKVSLISKQEQKAHYTSRAPPFRRPASLLRPHILHCRHLTLLATCILLALRIARCSAQYNALPSTCAPTCVRRQCCCLCRL